LIFNRVGFPHLPESPSWGYYLQLSIFVVAGITILVLSGLDLRRRKTPDALLLVLWVMGTFVFAAIVNWSANGRSILPMAPAAGIIAMRFLEDRPGNGVASGFKWLAGPLICSLLVAMTVTWADFRLAETAREAAQAIVRTHGNTARPLWFQGHWGFQYYMEQRGAKAYDRMQSLIYPGDVMVAPENNTNVFVDIMEQGTPLQIMQFTPTGFLTTMHYKGAGYYSSVFGPLPFLVDKDLTERYHIIVFPPTSQ
jgi:hypothetical protein